MRGCLLGGWLVLMAGAGWAQDQSANPDANQAAIQTGLAARGTPVSLHGTIRNAATGDALPMVLVRIEGDADAGALTDGAGHFEIPDVPAGPVILRLTKPGFHDRPYAAEEAGAQADGPAHSVLVAPEMPELEFGLTPASVIHGHIDLLSGDPAEAIPVNLLKQVVRYGRLIWAQVSQTKTNGDGAYRFAGLRDGVYAVFTEPVMDNDASVNPVAAGSAAHVARHGYPSVFYPDAREFAGAGRIRLGIGQQVEANLSLSLEPFHMVTAKVYLPNGQPYDDKAGTSDVLFGPEPIIAAVLDAGGHSMAYRAQYDGATHSVQATLPDGSYELMALANPAGRSRNQKQQAGFTEVTVAGRAVGNLRIPLSPLPSWPIRVSIERTRPEPAQTSSSTGGLETKVAVIALNTGEAPEANTSGESVAEPAGLDLLEMNANVPGTNWIHTQVGDRALCMGSFSAAGLNLAREPLVMSLGTSPPPIDLVLRDDCGKLQLELPASLSTFVPGEEPFYTVYVVPDFDSTEDMRPLTMHPSSGQTLELEGLTPGSYHVYTFMSPVHLEYRNPAVLAALPNSGQAVTLSPGSMATLVLEVPGP